MNCTFKSHSEGVLSFILLMGFMKKTLLCALLVFVGGLMSWGQKVDSIKVEQTGDYIRIGYKILDSRPGQIYRVRVLCSINGGLNTEIRSVSGDTGDNVQGGKPEYFVVWDVLKDVEELKSAEFIIRAELVSDINQPSSQRKISATTLKWNKKWFHIGPAIEMPGPKIGFMGGIMGSFGVAAIVTKGKYAIDGEVSVPIGVTVDLDEYIEGKNSNPVTLFITKRIVSQNMLQLHLMAGIQRSRMIFNDPNAMTTPYHDEKVFGPSAGLTLDINHAALTFVFTHIDPGQVEKEGDFVSLAPFNYLNAGLCFRF